VHAFRAQTVHNLNTVKIHHNTTAGATRDLGDGVCLHGHLHVGDTINERVLKMVARVGCLGQQGSSPPVDPNVAFFNVMERIRHK
jgi:hypothetical protein